MLKTMYDETNIFAKILRGEMPSEVIYEDDATLCFMDIMPRVKGHALVIPKAQSVNLLDIELSDLQTLIGVVQKIAQASMSAFNADGVTIQQFNNSAGGQMVFHTHFHILPRIDGVALRPHSGNMEDGDIIKANAEKYRAVLNC